MVAAAGSVREEGGGGVVAAMGGGVVVRTLGTILNGRLQDVKAGMRTMTAAMKNNLFRFLFMLSSLKKDFNAENRPAALKQ